MANVSLKTLGDYEGIEPAQFRTIIDQCPNPPSEPEYLSHWDGHEHPIMFAITANEFSGSSLYLRYQIAKQSATEQNKLDVEPEVETRLSGPGSGTRFYTFSSYRKRIQLLYRGGVAFYTTDFTSFTNYNSSIGQSLDYFKDLNDGWIHFSGNTVKRYPNRLPSAQEELNAVCPLSSYNVEIIEISSNQWMFVKLPDYNTSSDYYKKLVFTVCSLQDNTLVFSQLVEVDLSQFLNIVFYNRGILFNQKTSTIHLFVESNSWFKEIKVKINLNSFETESSSIDHSNIQTLSDISIISDEEDALEEVFKDNEVPWYARAKFIEQFQREIETLEIDSYNGMFVYGYAKFCNKIAIYSSNEDMIYLADFDEENFEKVPAPGSWGGSITLCDDFAGVFRDGYTSFEEHPFSKDFKNWYALPDNLPRHSYAHLSICKLPFIP